MRRTVLSTLLLATVGLAQPAPQGQAGRSTGMGSNPRSNEQNGVDIDRFVGYPLNAPAHLSHGTLLTHLILKAGDPYKAGAAREVLEYRKSLSTATLLPHNRTPLTTLDDQFFFYVQDGTGRLDDGKQSWELRAGLAILVPPKLPHRFVNTSDKQLNMIMLAWTAAGTPKRGILLRDVNLLPFCEENAHWNNTTKCIFGVNDGLFRGERIYAVMLQPWAMSQPHSHTPGTEEIWTKLTPGTAVMLLGSELREFPQNAAYLVPPTGITEHANLNLSKDRVEWWLYVARGSANPQANPLTSGVAPGAVNANQTPGPGGAASPFPGGGAFARNPNLSRDQAALDAATIAGAPLK